MELNDKSTCTFVVSNPGKFSLDVEYDLFGLAALLPHLQVEPKLDTVAVGGQSSGILTFCPQRKCVLKDLTFSVKVDPVHYLMSFLSFLLNKILFINIFLFLHYIFFFPLFVGKEWTDILLCTKGLSCGSRSGIFFPKAQLWKAFHILCWYGTCYTHTGD